MWRPSLSLIRLIIYYHLVYWAFTRFQGTNLLKPYVDPDAWRHPVEYARSLGYHAETHLVTTPDDVVLEVHRVSTDGPGCVTCGHKAKVPVILQHGLASSSFGWMANLVNQSLAFILADAGYDVWLANSRGNTYSKRSSATKPDFWAFTKDDLVLIDTPATIDYVLNATGSKSVHFVGHSQGGFILFGLLSEKPEYADKIKLGVALAPVLKLTHASPYITNLYKSLELLRWMPHFEVFTNHKFPINVLMNPVVCRGLPGLCNSLLHLHVGGHPVQCNASRAGVYASSFPAGSSYANVRQYSQTIVHGRFAKFDYGAEENLRRYKQREAPDYDLAKVRGKVSVFYSVGDNDIYAGAGHNKWLLESLPPKSLVHKEAIDHFEHIDFQLGINAKSVLYDKVIKLMRAHEK